MAKARLEGIDVTYLVQGTGTSAARALKELMPYSEIWNVLPPHQTGANVLDQILQFSRSVEQATSAPQA